MASRDSFLLKSESTERKIEIKHEIEKDSESPHIYLISILLCFEYFRGYVLFSSKDGALDLCLLLTEPEISQLEDLSYELLTYFPF